MRATFFDGRTARAHTVDLTIEGDLLVVMGEGFERRQPIGAVEIPEAPGSTPRVLRFVDGGSCEVQHGRELTELFARHGIAVDPVSVWERSWKMALGSLALVVVAGTLFYQ